MAGFSTYLADGIINAVLRGQAMPGIPGKFFALYTADPTDDNVAGAEVEAPWYARRATGPWSAPLTGEAYNTTRVEFAPVSGSSAIVTHVGIVDALVGGNLLFSEQLPEAKELRINDVYYIGTGVGTGDFVCAIEGASNHLANALLNYVLHGQAMPPLGELHYALFAADPTAAFTAGTEVAAAWYARMAAGEFAAPANGRTYNSVRVSFPRVVGAAQGVTHVGIVDASAGGRLLMYDALDAPRTLRAGDLYLIDSSVGSGDFTVALL